MATSANKGFKSTFHPHACRSPAVARRQCKHCSHKSNSHDTSNKKAKIPLKNFANMKKKSNFASCKAKSLKSEYKQYKNIKDDEKNIPTL